MEHKMKIWRDLNNYTQTALAKKVGTTAPNICRIEKGAQKPRHKLLMKLMDVTGLSADDFMCFPVLVKRKSA